jgi:plasmid maintenance system killer protein
MNRHGVCRNKFNARHDGNCCFCIRPRSLNDLRSPYGNHLEALKDDRTGQPSIRVNDQWRICFRWEGEDGLDVEIVDYH